MANEDLRIRISAQIAGLDQVESLKNAVRQLQTTAAPASADLQKLKNAAMQLGGAADRTENDLRRSINALKDVRAQLTITDREYQKLTGTINKYQAQLDKATGAQQRGGKALQFAQTAGAVAASGVFGGPEGLIGAGVGAFFGPQGALAGGAIGAQVGMARQQVNQFATYAADISKLEIALKGVTKTQEEYQRALAASASVSRDFNVPQLEATQNMTRLSAAVIGAGGKVADSEVVFRNVTAAIKATGGGVEQVNGAMTAFTQIFSKGKLSAEEINQIAERLPGAFTMIAKAAGKTGPELSKALEQGTVGLDTVMKFVVELGNRYGDSALKVAKSSADAGARLTNTWNDTKRAIGEAILPLGAQIQDSLAQALRDATPALVGFAQGLSAAIKVLVDNGPLIGNVLKTLLGFGAIAGVAVGVAQLGTALSAATAFVAGFGGAAGVATLAVESLGIAIAAVPGIGWIAAGVTALGLLTKALYDNNEAFRTWVNNVGSIISSDFKNAWDNAVAIVSISIDKIKSDWNSLVGIASKIGTAIGNAFAAPFGIIASVADNVFGGVYRQIVQLINSIPAPLRKRLYDNAVDTGASILSLGNPVARYGASVGIRALTGGAPAPDAGATGMYGRYDSAGGQAGQAQTSSALTEWEKLQEKIESDKKKAADKAKADAERLAAEQQRLNESTARAEIDLQNAVHRSAMDLIRKRHEYQRELQNIELDNWVKGFTGAGKSAAGMIAGFLGQIADLRTRTLDAEIAVRNAQQQQRSAQAMASVTAGGGGGGTVAGRYIQGGIGPRGANQYGPHFDIKRSDGGYYSRNALDAYVRVNGMPLSSGVTVPGGEYGAPRAYGGHAGRDYAFGAGAALTLTGGAKWMGSTPGSYGDAAAFMTPDGKVYKIIHGKFEGSAGTASGQGAQQRRAVAAAGKAGAEGVDLSTAQQVQKMTADQVDKLRTAIGSGFVSDYTQQLREQIDAQQAANFALEYRNKLEESGMRPEFIEAQIKKAEAARLVTEQVSAAGQALQILEEAGQGNTAEANRLREAIEALVKLYPQLSKAIEDNAKKQAAAADAQKQFGKQFKQTFKQAYDSATNLGANLASIAVNGIDGLTNAIVEFASTGKAAFKEFAASVLKDLGAMLIKFAIFSAIKGIFPGLNLGVAATGGATGPNSAAPLRKFANGGVMTNNVVPLKRYAQGGIARSPELALYGERGPEAYVPLPDGRTIPVKMKQRNDALNRYRPIGATGTMAPGGEMAAGAAGAEGGAAGPIDVRYSVERINNVEYVTAEQFQQGLRQAAAQGAQRGEQRALRSLQQSTAVRNRVGMR